MTTRDNGRNHPEWVPPKAMCIYCRHEWHTGTNAHGCGGSTTHTHDNNQLSLATIDQAIADYTAQLTGAQDHQLAHIQAALTAYHQLRADTLLT